MSFVEKLQIQGIRSFGAKAEDAQALTFTSPVTLILGENGCGKTTIIECLKYALAGEAPPGSERGRNFVHDPKIFGLVDSLGQIKLIVRNLKGERLSVCRSMRFSYRKSKPTFETLDSTVNYLGTEEDPVKTNSLSKRVADTDMAMCEFMGVSKAIINNVLFCHQEDSNWPLDEGKKLKEKFDAIFGIVEHNKAIEKLGKMRKDKAIELKLLEKDVEFLEHFKQEMDNKTLSLQKAREKCEKIIEECSRCEKEIEPIEERMGELLKIETEMGKFNALKVKVETKQKNCNEQIASLTKKIEKMFEGDLDALDTELRAFDEKVTEKQAQQSELQSELQKLQKEAQVLQKNFNDADKKRCMCIKQRETEQECTAKRAEKMKSLAAELNVTIVEEDLIALPQTRIAAILEDLKSALLSQAAQMFETEATHDNEDQQRQTEIDALRVELTKLEASITTMQKQFTSQQKEADQLDMKIIEIEKSTGRLKLVTSEIQRLEECYEEAAKSMNQDERRKEIADGKEQITKLQEQYKKLDERLTFLNSIAKSMAEINLKQQELEKKEQEVRRLKSKHGESIQIVVGKPVDSNYRRTLQGVCTRLRQEIKDLNDREKAANLKEQKIDIERKNLKDELTRLEKQLEESKEQVFQKCHDVAYEDLLEKSKAVVSKYQIEYSALCSAENMYKRYLQKIEEEPCCPLCHKSMSTDEKADLSSELNDEIHQLPANKTRAERLLKAETKKYEALLALRPVIEKVTALEADIPKRKEELKELQTKLAECATELESIQMAALEPNNNYNLANGMLGDMSLLDEALKDASRLKENIEKLKRKLPEGADAAESVEDVQIEKTTVAAELEDKRKRVEEMQQELQKLVDMLNQLREKKNSLKDEQIKLQEGVQSLPELKKHQVELVSLLETTSDDLKTAKGKVQPSKQKLAQTIKEKARLKEANRKTIIEMQKKLDAHKSLNQEVQRLNTEVEELQQLNLEAELAKLKEALISYKNDISKNISSSAGKSIELDELKTEIAKQQNLKRDLKDNRELKLLQQKQIELAAELEELSKQVGDLDYRATVREKNVLIAKRDRITERKSALLGQKGEINNQIAKLEKDIEEPRYKNSLVNYRKAKSQVEIKKAVIADLGRYRLALEWALIQFHAEKMKRINSLIREYWRLIYRGNDIDYIEIKTDEPTTEMSAADKRRSYNYRVVQSKNDTEIEMRGRCSAGQRVLACLIIRMALAETFSSNCGVLALDEPTTNLDRQNILSLCDALNRIVEERQFQPNFMLVIITHDENFIMQLGKIENYHRVFRNSEGKSVIRKVKVA